VLKLFVALLVIICIAMAVTNPDAEAHKKVFYANLPKEVGAKGLWQKLAGAVMENADVIPVEYHNYFFYSTMTLRDETISYGLFNQIWPAEWVESVKKEWVPKKADDEA